MSRQSHQPPFRIAYGLGTGRLVSILTALIAFLVMFSGVLPLRWFRYQDFEIARQVLQWDAPFIPNLHMRTRFFEGDEARTGNLPPTESLPWRNFTTDRFGFRYCPPVAPGKPIDLVVFRGISFAFGYGLGDEETFAAQLARQTGINAYNAARFLEDPETPEAVDRLMAKIGAHPKTFVYVHLEADSQVLTPAVEHYNLRRHLLWYAKLAPLQWIRMSPAILNAVEAKKFVENDFFLHNRYRDNVRSFTLPDGARFLVRKGYIEDAEAVEAESVVSGRADLIAWWNQRLAERGARMVVLLVPARMSVYGPALGIHTAADPFLNRLARNLDAKGIPVVNGLPLLRATAAEDLASGRLAYLREDEHWSALGVERLAKATAAAMKSEDVVESSIITAKPVQ